MFFESFREAIARLPAGLIRGEPPASAAEIAAAETDLRGPLPTELRAFLLCFDGADLFHGNIVLGGVGPQAQPRVQDLNEPARAAGAVTFAEAGLGDRFVLDAQGRVWRLRAGSDERILTGSTFTRWLDAVIAHERILYDAEGEFLGEAFEPDGEEVTAKTARRQAERALKHDPGSAEAHHELGTALRRLGHDRQAATAFQAATALDPENPWPWFDLGRVLLEGGGDSRGAVDAFWQAAGRESELAAARLYAWAARAAAQAGDTARLEQARQAARERHSGIAEDLQRAVDSAAAEDEPDALAEAQALLAALTGVAAPAPRRRLPVVTQTGPTDDRRKAPPRTGGKTKRPADR